MVSIITPIYNRLDLVPETWESIKSQTYTNWEWLVVDDGSTDGGIDYIKELSKKDKRVKLILLETGVGGPSRCRNIGVNRSNGDYILFLDSDDILSQTCLEKRVVFLEKNPALDFAVFTQATFEDTISPNQPVFSKFYTKNSDYLKAFIADQHPWQTSGPLWRKGPVLQLGGFREDYRIMEDPEFHIRALLKGFQFEVIKDAPDFFYRLVPKTKEQELVFWENSIKGRIVFYKDLYPQLHTHDQLKAITKGILNFYKDFLLARIDQYNTDHQCFLKWVKKNRLLSSTEIWLIKLYSYICRNKRFKKLPIIKGLVFRYL